MKDARSRADRIRAVVAAENEAWDRATERRADAEYALEEFEESPEFDGTSERFQIGRPSALGVERRSAQNEKLSERCDEWQLV